MVSERGLEMKPQQQAFCRSTADISAPEMRAQPWLRGSDTTFCLIGRMRTLCRIIASSSSLLNGLSILR
jgi:hypothetical protein